jgi:outer membrane protein assembly factor BamB
MRKKVFILIAGLLTVPLFAQNPDEWPILNNINHTGFSETTVLRPPLKLKWAAKVQGSFKAGPVIAESCMVAQSRDGYVFCFDAFTGELKWRYFVKRLGAHYVGDTFTGPCIWNGRAYASFYSVGHTGVTGMRCFDLKTGRLLWKKDVGYTGHRIHYSPQVSNGRLFWCSNRETTGLTTENTALLNHEAQVQCWDAATGDTLWTYTMWAAECENTTLLCMGDTIVASVGLSSASAEGRTVAFDPDGNVLWQSTAYHVGGYCGNLQYVPGKLMMLRGSNSTAVTILSTADWSVLLDNGGGDQYSKTVPVMNGRYYNRGYGGWARPYSMTTGQSLPFSGTRGGGAYSGCSAPVAANGYIYNGFGNKRAGTNMNGHQIAATDEAGNQVWAYQDCANHCASVGVAYGMLYGVAGTEGMVYCFENAQ